MDKVLSVCALLVLASCGPEQNQGEADAAVEQAWALPRSCTDTLETAYAAPSGLPAHDPSQRGRVLRCAADTPLGVAEIEASLQGAGFVDAAVHNPLRVYRILYRTERLLGQGGLTAALVLLPERPIAPRPPVIVFAHGLNGTDTSCAFSRQSLLSMRDNEARTALYLASYGFPVIAPDYPGFLAGEAAAPLSSEDEAHSLLDATRALRTLLPAGSTSEQVVLVGHSQGGHAVLSAQALAAGYGLSGELNAVVALAPWWSANRVFARILAPETGLDTTDNGLQIGLALQYFAGHTQLHDGPGAVQALFQPAALALLATAPPSCGTGSLAALGKTPADFLAPSFLDPLAACAVQGGAACETGLAATWETRFRADRPHLDPHGAALLTWHGMQDRIVTADFSQCAVDRIETDGVEHTACGDSSADHETLLSHQASWTARWIAARTSGGVPPAACPDWNELNEASCLQPPNID